MLSSGSNREYTNPISIYEYTNRITLHKPDIRERPMAILESGRKNIAVLGAGFAGITAILMLRKLLRRRGLLGRYNMILADKNAHHLYTPALYEIAAIPKGEAEAVCLKSAHCVQIEDILKPFPEIRFIGEEIEKLDPRTHIIRFKSGDRLSFEYAVVALGSETNFFGIPGLQENSYPLKTFRDAVRLRNKAEEIAATNSDPVKIVIGGGGATGVELSAEFIYFFKYLKKRTAKKSCDAEITLVEAGPEILPGFSSQTATRAKKRLQKLGIRILTRAPIASVTPSEVMLKDGRVIPCHILIWSGGVTPAAVLKNFGLPLDKKGGLIVNEFLEARPRIYAVGDNASFTNPKTERPVPWNVPAAEAEARLAAKNIAADIEKGKKRPFQPLKNYPFILAIGAKFAIADLIVIKSFGLMGWIMKQLVELRYLLFILPWAKAIKMWLRTIYYGTRND